MRDRLLRMRDVAEITGLHPDTIRTYIRKGHGPEVIRTPTNKFLFEERAVLEWLDSMKTRKRAAEAV
jgi:predicted DNA-binding transcriptional regulator AlpA